MIKIIKDGQIIDIVSTPSYIKFSNSGIVTRTIKETAQGVLGSNGESIYSFTPVAFKTAGVVKAVDITEPEFLELKGQAEQGQAFYISDKLLTQVKQQVINKLSETCKVQIISGFNITLSDGNNYHFTLTSEDQLNLLSFENQLRAGTTTFVYHATGSPSKVFSRRDMQKIINQSKKHILFHTTYFNAAKHYLESVENIDEVNLFEYGNDVSATVKDPYIKQILKSRGASL